MGFIMESSEDRKNRQTNLMYFNQMLEESGKSRATQKAKNKEGKKVRKSFGAQKIDFSDYVMVLEGYESVIYPLYFLTIPYVTGAIVLFLFVAGASFEKFKLIEFNSFLVVWMIGYEIVSTFILIAIFIAFLRYDHTPQNTRHF